ncbi:MAG: CBS domain-containing protein [Gemmataceae bacterium]|nr:CBS domain-containing protein [Gemmataceae bacterium]
MSTTPPSSTPIRVRDIMSRYVVSVTTDTPVIEVARILAERRFSGLPVLNEDGGFVGMVSDFDLLARDGNTAGEVMSPEVATVSEDTDIREARALLIEQRLARLPVFRGRDLVGIVSRGDILRELVLHWICDVCGEVSRGRTPPERCWKCGTADQFRHERQSPGM